VVCEERLVRDRTSEPRPPFQVSYQALQLSSSGVDSRPRSCKHLALAREPADDFNHVNRNTDRASLVSHRTRDRLADPPSCIGRELVNPLCSRILSTARIRPQGFPSWIQSPENNIPRPV
jgi:hypothetical protein